MTYLNREHNHLSDRILSDLTVKIFKIKFWEGDTVLSPEIVMLQQLEELNIAKNARIRDYPPEITELLQLKVIRHYHCHLKKLPETLANIPALEVLQLSHNSFNKNTKWSVLTKLKKLKHLDLSFALQSFAIMPAAICKISSLESLDISGNQLNELPDAIADLHLLKKLNCSGNRFTQFPKILSKLHHLISLDLPVQSLKEIPEDALDLLNIPTLNFHGKSAEPINNDLKVLVRTLRTKNFSNHEAVLFLKIVQEKISITSLNNQDLYSVLRCGVRTYIHRALIEIEKRIEHGNMAVYIPLKKGNRVVFTGKTNSKNSDIKQLFWQQDIKTGVKTNNKTTHVLLGYNPDITYEAIVENGWGLLTEQMAIRLLNKEQLPYLMDTSSPVDHYTLDNIRHLLRSEQEELIVVALQLLKSGGLPDALITDLFLLYKLTKSQKIKRITFQILSQYAPLNFTAKLKHRKKIGPGLTEQKLRLNLEYYTQDGLLDATILTDYLWHKYQLGLSFALFNLKKEEKAAFIGKIMSKGYLNLSNLDLEYLPTDLAQINTIHHLNLSNNKFLQFPEVLYDFVELHSIEICGIEEVLHNPKALMRIDGLQTIIVDKKSLFSTNTIHAFKQKNIQIHVR